jgi:hypothetical protein
MPLFETFSIVLLAAIVWLWFDSVKARDIAIEAARRACAADGVQFLDDTVAIASLQPARDDDGRLVLRRAYAFEYSVSGDDRRPGSIVLLGQQVMFVNVGLRLAGQ